MNKDEDISMQMIWEEACWVSDAQGPEDYIYVTEGKLINTERADELIGQFKLYYVDIERALNDRMSIIDILDGYQQTLEYKPLFGSQDYGFSDRVVKAVGEDIMGFNLLILDRLEILPKYRGKKLGLDALKFMISRFSAGASVVAIKPFPLQFESMADDGDQFRTDLALDQFEKSEQIATKKLRDYYGTLRFRQVKGTPFMVRSTGRG